MSEVLKEEGGEEELSIVEADTIPEPGAKQPDPQEDEDDEDDSDERLAESEDDHEEEIASGSKNRERRLKRREVQRRAKEAAERELAFLRQQVAEQNRRLAAVEGHAVTTNVTALDQQLAQATEEYRQAEYIIAKATDAGIGEDVVAAMRIRDAAAAKAQQLASHKQQLTEAARQAAQPRVDPAVADYAKQWLQANPWYDPNGGDEDSRVTKAIDDGLVREGYDPRSRDYWQELTRRVSARIADEPAPETRRRKAPPTGNTREHVPVSTRKEVYVTPERKQAMIDAGVWDDPAARQRYLKAYAEFDANSSAR